MRWACRSAGLGCALTSERPGSNPSGRSSHRTAPPTPITAPTTRRQVRRQLRRFRATLCAAYEAWPRFSYDDYARRRAVRRDRSPGHRGSCSPRATHGTRSIRLSLAPECEVAHRSGSLGRSPLSGALHGGGFRAGAGVAGRLGRVAVRRGCGRTRWRAGSPNLRSSRSTRAHTICADSTEEYGEHVRMRPNTSAGTSFFGLMSSR